MINQRSTLREYWGFRYGNIDGIKGCMLDFKENDKFDDTFVSFDTLCRCNHYVGDHYTWGIRGSEGRRCSILDCGCKHPKEKTFEYMIRGLG